MSKSKNKPTEEIKKNNEIGYRISKIHTVRFAFEDSQSEDVSNLFNSPNALGLNLSFAINISLANSTIAIDVISELINNEDNTILIAHTGRTVFFVQGLESTYIEEKKSYDLPNQLLVQLYGLSFTHSRALLATEVSPTCYRDRYFLPIIDPSTLINLTKNG